MRGGGDRFDLRARRFMSFTRSNLRETDTLLRTCRNKSRCSRLDEPSVRPDSRGVRMSSLRSVFVSVLHGCTRTRGSRRSRLVRQ